MQSALFCHLLIRSLCPCSLSRGTVTTTLSGAGLRLCGTKVSRCASRASRAVHDADPLLNRRAIGRTRSKDEIHLVVCDRLCLQPLRFKGATAIEVGKLQLGIQLDRFGKIRNSPPRIAAG